MKKFFTRVLVRLSGYDWNIVQHTSSDTQIKLSAAGGLLVFVLFLSLFGGYKIGDIVYPIGYTKYFFACCFSACITSFDYFIIVFIKSKDINIIRTRLAISVLLSFFVALPLPMHLAKDKIEATLSKENAAAITACDSSFQVDIENAKASLNAKEKTMDSSLRSFVREGLTGHLGKYEDKYHLYKKDSMAYALEKIETDSIIQIMAANHAVEIKILQDVKNTDFISRAECLFKLSIKYPFIGFMVLAIIIVIVAFDTAVVTFKGSYSKAEDDYNFWSDEINKRETVNNKILLDQRAEISRNELKLNAEKERIKADAERFSLLEKQLNDKIVESTFIELLKKKAKENGLEDFYENINEIVNKYKHQANNKSCENIFHVTKPMQTVIDSIKENSNEVNLMHNVYSWVLKNITYNTEHTRNYYQTAAQTFNSKTGICGEISNLLIAFYRTLAIECFFCEVTKDDTGKEVTHACVAVKRGNNYQLIDVAYQSFDINHEEFRIITDDELALKFKHWNQ